MLRLYMGHRDDTVYNTSVYFDNTYEDEWICNDRVKEMIKDIDKSDVIGGQCIMSPVLGQIPPTKIAGGTKTLILMMFDDSQVYNLSTCGNNCAKWILEIGKLKDIEADLGYLMNFGDGDFEIEIMNSGKVVRNQRDFVNEAVKFI